MSLRRPIVCAALALVLLALSRIVPDAEGLERYNRKDRQRIEQLEAEYRDWLAAVELLITKTELEAFLELDKNYQRDAFIEQFWRQRDPYPSTARNEFRSRWERRLEQALLEFGSMEDERATIYMINGDPAGRLTSNCTAVWPLEIWFYRAMQPNGPGFDMLLLFYQRFGDAEYRLWDPAEGLSTLSKFISPMADPGRVFQEIDSSCADSDEILGAINFLLRQGTMEFNSRMLQLKQPRNELDSTEWVATFNAFSTDVPEGTASFPAELDLTFPGRFQTRTVVQAALLVDPAAIGTSDLGGVPTYNFVLTGEVLQDESLFDNFHYQFNLRQDSLRSEKLPLVFERKLRPGTYQVILKLEDLNSDKVYRELREVEVPYVEERAPTRPTDPETARMLAEANAALDSGDNTLQIVPPTGNLLAGLVRFNTLVTGPDIAEVEFSFDGRPLFRKRTPPYSVELDLGSLPRRRLLTAVAFDSTGNEVARDELVVNSGKHRFEVRLLEPRQGADYSGSLRAVAEVEVPEERRVEKVEFYLNEDLVATLFQPPWEQPILLPPDEEVAYVRAVAYQPDGNSTEDLVFVNAPDYLEEVDVQFVELYIAVTDKQKRPVDGLTEADFRVLEDGVPQTPMRFDRVSNLPIHAGVVVDVSASMEPNMEMAKQAALGFFEEAIGPKDRATLITFNDHPTLSVKLTNEIEDLASGLAGLKAERGTALYDAVVFSLYYFNGVKGQRALVILSDGKDESSRFTFDDTLEYARRAGVAIYAIGLEYKKTDRIDRKRLERLAAETGGQSFFIDSADELEAIYQTIQHELRSRYYLAYQSTNTSDTETFRTIEVEVVPDGLDAKTMSGYYP